MSNTSVAIPGSQALAVVVTGVEVVVVATIPVLDVATDASPLQATTAIAISATPTFERRDTYIPFHSGL
jgi:hypothetical protein